MNPDDLARILDDLGERLGPTGEYVFGLAVRQSLINGVTCLVLGVVAVVAGYRLVGWLRRFATEDKALAATKPYHTTSYEFAYVFGGIGLLILGGFGLFALSLAADNLLNPEYAAIRSLLSSIRGAS
jgi:hypothetical protein